MIGVDKEPVLRNPGTNDFSEQAKAERHFHLSLGEDYIVLYCIVLNYPREQDKTRMDTIRKDWF
jgi:hypothetical protein